MAEHALTAEHLRILRACADGKLRLNERKNWVIVNDPLTPQARARRQLFDGFGHFGPMISWPDGGAKLTDEGENVLRQTPAVSSEEGGRWCGCGDEITDERDGEGATRCWICAGDDDDSEEGQPS